MIQLKSHGSVFKIETVNGQGLSATVFRALREDSQGHSRQTVALKVFKNEDTIEWVKREFETLAKVDSPHCVRVLGWENLDEGVALVLEWIDGLTLFQLARDHHLSQDLKCEILAQVQDGLRALQSHGLWHGDLSPANILVDRTGCIKLIDFAGPQDGDPTVIGTPAYLPIEVWDGKRRTFESDLFALGLIEADLQNSILQGPVALEASAARARALATAEPGLLSLQPHLRKFKDIQSSPQTKTLLAQLVTEKLNESSVSSTPTALILQAEPFWKRNSLRWAASVAALVFATTASVQARAPQIAPLHTVPAAIFVHTQNWFLISLNCFG